MAKQCPTVARALAVVLACCAARAGAQIPGAPVLQNAFGTPGLAVAANYAGGGGSSLFAAASAWGPRSGRLQVSAAAGAQRGSGATRGAYGGRLAANVWNSRSGALAGGAFAGVGGAPRARVGNTVALPAQLIVPVGITVGYRRAIGETRGLAAYVAPMYRWTRSDDGNVSTSGTLRASFGADVTLSPAFGVTVGGELGASDSASRVPGGTFGLAVTFVPGRR